MVAPVTAKETAGDSAPAAPRRGISRAMRWTGLALGTCLAVLAFMDGARLRVGGMPSWLGAALGAALVWALIVLACAALSELTVRHHRAAIRGGWRHSRRGAVGAWRWSRPHRARAGAAVRARWAARRGGPLIPGAADDGEGECIYCGAEDGEPCTEDCAYRRQDRRAMRRIQRERTDAAGPGPDSGPAPAEPPAWPYGTPEDPPGPGAAEPAGPQGCTYSWGPEASPAGWPARDPADADSRARHASTSGKPYVVTEYPPGGGPGKTIATYLGGKPVQPSTPSAPSAPSPEGTTMTQPAPAPAPARTGRTSGRKVPPAWRAIIAMIDDFEPENDSDLHDFLQGLAAGLHDVGESLADLYETCTAPGLRIGKGGMSATHDAADAIAEASGGVAGASRALEQYYAGVSEEVAAGIELPRDGDFLTGDGAVG